MNTPTANTLTVALSEDLMYKKRETQEFTIKTKDKRFPAYVDVMLTTQIFVTRHKTGPHYRFLSRDDVGVTEHFDVIRIILPSNAKCLAVVFKRGNISERHFLYTRPSSSITLCVLNKNGFAFPDSVQDSQRIRLGNYITRDENHNQMEYTITPEIEY